ncbi:MAG: hypothetical protein EBE86_008980 [Hormoscilla sp. GUM202]|nr:hypothetical protein [Hormoscilla sp. GUM202]
MVLSCAGGRSPTSPDRAIVEIGLISKLYRPFDNELLRTTIECQGKNEED